MSQKQKKLDEQPSFLAAWEEKLAERLSRKRNALHLAATDALEADPENDPRILLSEQDKDLSLMRWNVFIPKKKYPYASTHGYHRGRGHVVFMHRVIARRMLGRELSRWDIVDHINHNTLDNRRENLRIGDHHMNGCNMRKQKPSKTGFIGVHKAKNRWRALMHHRGKYVPISGSYDTPEEAAKRYDEVSAQLGRKTRNFY